MPNPILNTIMKTIGKAHIFIYRTSGGTRWKMMLGSPVLLLTTTGRKSGKKRTTPVVYNREGDNYLIAASMNGADNNPSWYHNIKGSGEATIEVGSQTLQCQAEILEGEARNTAYQRFKDQAENFIKYEQKTDRIIPVIRLIPQS